MTRKIPDLRSIEKSLEQHDAGDGPGRGRAVAHRQRDIGLRQHGGVIHAIPHHQHPRAVTLQLAHEFALVLGTRLAADAVDADGDLGILPISDRCDIRTGLHISHLDSAERCIVGSGASVERFQRRWSNRQGVGC